VHERAEAVAFRGPIRVPIQVLHDAYEDRAWVEPKLAVSLW
jgi:hypothetical protein